MATLISDVQILELNTFPTDGSVPPDYGVAEATAALQAALDQMRTTYSEFDIIRSDILPWAEVQHYNYTVDKVETVLYQKAWVAVIHYSYMDYSDEESSV